MKYMVLIHSNPQLWESLPKEEADRVLTPGGHIDKPRCRELVDLANGKAVFHRAFDFLRRPFRALDELTDLGFERVLTSGGASTAEAGATRLAALIQHAGWQIQILPAGKILVPGVVSHGTNVVEHPELIAERLTRFAECVGRENIIAGTDCGFAQEELNRRVHRSVMWAKFEAMAEGARIATKQLWN